MRFQVLQNMFLFKNDKNKDRQIAFRKPEYQNILDKRHKDDKIH